MLKRQYRYPFSEGVPEKSYSTPYFTLRFRKRSEGFTRCAVVVGKKVDVLSSVRHTIKRSLLLMVEDALPEWDAPYDIVIYTKKAIVTSEEAMIRKAVLLSLTQADIIK